MKKDGNQRSAISNQRSAISGQQIAGSKKLSVVSAQSSANSLKLTAKSKKHGRTGPGLRTKGWSAAGVVIFFVIVGAVLVAQSSLLIAANEPAKQEEKKAGDKGAKPDAKAEFKTEDRKRSEIAEKEEALKKEEERLNTIRKELDEKIDRYTKLLAKIEETLKAVDAARGEQYEHLVKAYEAMPNEEAATRISALDEQTAIKILVRIKSKKAGAVMAAMEPQKAAALTEGMMSIVKKVPTR